MISRIRPPWPVSLRRLARFARQSPSSGRGQRGQLGLGPHNGPEAPCHTGTRGGDRWLCGRRHRRPRVRSPGNQGVAHPIVRRLVGRHGAGAHDGHDAVGGVRIGNRLHARRTGKRDDIRPQRRPPRVEAELRSEAPLCRHRPRRPRTTRLGAHSGKSRNASGGRALFHARDPGRLPHRADWPTATRADVRGDAAAWRSDVSQSAVRERSAVWQGRRGDGRTRP